MRVTEKNKISGCSVVKAFMTCCSRLAETNRYLSGAEKYQENDGN